MLENYLPVVIQLTMAAGFAVSTLIVSVLLGKSASRSTIKDSAYECGMLPIGDAQPRFSVKFYLIAMLFVLFDIEVVFMYPWAIVFKDFITSGVTSLFWSMTGFVLILSVAYAYAWKKGAFEWK
jgi:NADH-quinone oxidoreductase subunit A